MHIVLFDDGWWLDIDYQLGGFCLWLYDESVL